MMKKLVFLSLVLVVLTAPVFANTTTIEVYAYNHWTQSPLSTGLFNCR